MFFHLPLSDTIAFWLLLQALILGRGVLSPSGHHLIYLFIELVFFVVFFPNELLLLVLFYSKICPDSKDYLHSWCKSTLSHRIWLPSDEDLADGV